jgi:hypothetical protein
MKVVNLSASEQCNCCDEFLYYGLNSFIVYSFQITVKIANTISKKDKKTFCLLQVSSEFMKRALH